MRPIIFRAKRVDNGEWVYGFYVRIGKFHLIFTGKLKIVGQNSADFEYYEVIPETVGQFTGELDFNGKKIFEGDIIQNKDRYVYSGQYKAVVKFEYGKFYGEGWCDFAPELFHLCEVIGNVTDNPELLEEQK